MPLSPHQIRDRPGQARRQERRGAEARARHMSLGRVVGGVRVCVCGGSSYSLPGTNRDSNTIQRNLVRLGEITSREKITCNKTDFCSFELFKPAVENEDDTADMLMFICN